MVNPFFFGFYVGPREARARCSGWVRKSKPPTDRPTRPPKYQGRNLTRLLIKKWKIFNENWIHWGTLLLRKWIISDEIWWNWDTLLFWKWTIFDEHWWTWDTLLCWKWTNFGENWWHWNTLLLWKWIIFDETWWYFAISRTSGAPDFSSDRPFLTQKWDFETHLLRSDRPLRMR